MLGIETLGWPAYDETKCTLDFDMYILRDLGESLIIHMTCIFFAIKILSSVCEWQNSSNQSNRLMAQHASFMTFIYENSVCEINCRWIIY